MNINNFTHEQKHCSTVLMTHYGIVYGIDDWEIKKKSRPSNLPLGGCRGSYWSYWLVGRSHGFCGSLEINLFWTGFN